MKKYVKAELGTKPDKFTRKTFRICYNDGNKKLFEADNIYDALSFVLFERGDNASDIWKIEEA